MLLSQNSNSSQGLEEYEDNTLTFTPEIKYKNLISWNGGFTYNYYIEATGVINVTYNQSQKVVFNGKKCQIDLENQTISNKKTALTGGYSDSKKNIDNSVPEQAANYIKNNLDKFKQLAIQQIPEAVNAINIVVETPSREAIHY